MSEILWQPGEERIAASNLTHFTNWLSKRSGWKFPDYYAVHQWSIERLEDFWEAFLEFTGIIFSERHTRILDLPKMPGAKWFQGMRLNFAENILGRNYHGPAIISLIESEEISAAEFNSISFDELKNLVARCARGLQNLGIQPGDRVAGYVANVPEAIIAALACASRGATWSSASPDFGIDALCDRFLQVEPKLVFASTHYRYNGKTFRTDNVVRQLRQRLPSLRAVVSIPYPADEATFVGDISWEEFLGNEDQAGLYFNSLPFDHPLYILFSSGTTGAPKCMIHGAGGTLLQHRKELQLHCDIKPGDVLLYFTTCGWMMWNWQLSALSLGATIGLYDGIPGYPDLTALWRLVDELNVTHFGTSGRFIESCMKHQPPILPGSLGAFESLKTILYTGSPLSESGFRWVYETVKKDVHLAGISGGTDIVSCFVLGNPNLPVRAGEIQCKGLGVDVTAFDDAGNEVVNQPGELVCRQPLPCMPVGFLNDRDGEKYRGAYFDIYPGIWRHGDYVTFTPHGGLIIHGRSDATLNPGGVRIGSAEIYSALDHLAEIKGAVVAGWVPPNQSDEVIVLFVVLEKERKIDKPIEDAIRKTIRSQRSPRHVPHHIFQLSEIPVTRSGKTVELSVKAILAGREAANQNALANPHVLEEIQQIHESLIQLYI
jgi:acetoacetyl-CoA synthetase